MASVIIKDAIHHLIGWFLDVEPLTANDELWLYDFPINPVNVPSFLVIKKTNTDPEVMFQKMFKAIGRDHRCGVKMVKIFGKYYFKRLNDEEYAKYIKVYCGIKPEITSEKEAIEFALKMKSLEGKSFDMCTCRAFYLPNFSETESAYLVLGHHTHQDGISQFQSFFAFSDEPQKVEYPFFKRKAVSLLEWAVMILTLPLSGYRAVSYYYARPYDLNCIKKARFFVSGKLRAKLAKPISLAKGKALAKTMGLTFNDLVMGLLSKALKTHFVANGDP